MHRLINSIFNFEEIYHFIFGKKIRKRNFLKQSSILIYLLIVLKYNNLNKLLKK